MTKALEAVGFEDMEKSFNDSLESLKTTLNSFQKAKKDDEEANEFPGEEEEAEGDEDDEEDGKKPTMKSLEEFVAEDDADAGAAMDIEPFLRSLVKGIDEKFAAVNAAVSTMQKSIKDVAALSKAQVQFAVASAEMQKAVRDTVEKIGDAPVPSRSVLRKSGDRFEAVEAASALSRVEILDKAMKLCKAGKLDVLDVTKIEGRLNKNIPLDERHVALIKSVQ